MNDQNVLGQHIMTISGTFKSIRHLVILLGFILVVIVVGSGASNGNWGEIRSELPSIFLIWIVVIGFLRVVVQFMRVHVFTGGIQGRSYGGFRRRFRWDDIAGSRFDGVGGFHVAVLTERTGHKELWMLREIAESEEFRSAVQPYIDWDGLEGFDS